MMYGLQWSKTSFQKRLNCSAQSFSDNFKRRQTLIVWIYEYVLNYRIDTNATHYWHMKMMFMWKEQKQKMLIKRRFRIKEKNFQMMSLEKVCTLQYLMRLRRFEWHFSESKCLHESLKYVTVSTGSFTCIKRI